MELWLRSQLTQVEDLQIQLLGRGDNELSIQQLMSGQIPQISLKAQRVVYQGLHFSQVHFISNKIPVNLGRILQGHPFQLLAPVPVNIELILEESDFNASLHSSLLLESLKGILLDWLKSHPQQLKLALRHLDTPEQLAQLQVKNLKINLTQQIIFRADLPIEPAQSLPLTIHASIRNIEPHKLQLESFQCWIQTSEKVVSLTLAPHAIVLDPQITIQEIELQEEQLICRGQVMLLP